MNKDFPLEEFKKFATYLLASPSVKERLLKQHFFDLKEAQLPLFSNYNEQNLEEVSAHSLKNFLEEVVKNHSNSFKYTSFRGWIAANLPDLPEKEQFVQDVVRIFSLRKMLFVDFIREYTQDIMLFAAIVKEQEELFSYLEQEHFQEALEIRKSALFQERELTSSIVNNSVNGILAFDKELKITEWNSVMERWTQIEKKRAMGKNFFALLPDYRNSREGNLLRKALQGEQNNVPEARFKDREGFFEADIIPLYDLREQISGGVCIIHETTHRKKAEEKLKDANIELLKKKEDLDETIGKLRKARKKLAKRGKRLQEAQAIAKVGSWDWKPSKDRMQWSDEMKRLTGHHGKEKIKLSTYLRYVHPDERDMVRESFEKAFQDCSSFTIEHRIISESQQERCLLVNGKVYQGPFRLSGTCLDITEQKEREKELQELHYFLQQIADGIPGLIFLYDREKGEYIYTNHSIHDFLGYQKEEVFESTSDFIRKVVHPQDQEVLQELEQIYQSMAPGESVDIQVRLKHKSGTWRWFRAKSKIFRYNEEGKPAIILGLGEDITELKEVEEHISEARDYYLQILEDFPALIWRAGTDGKCNYFNKGWLDFTGRRLQEEIGDGWAEGIHPDDLDACFQTYINSFQAREAFEMEYRLKRKDGEYRYLLDYGKPLFGLKGEFLGYVGACFDLQDRKDAQKLIHQKNIELAAALKELTSAEEQLREANRNLEKRVEERTAELRSRENFLNSILDQSPVSTSLTDHNGSQIRVNQAFLDLFGIKDPGLSVGKYNILKDEILLHSPFHKDVAAVFEEGEVARVEVDYNISKLVHINIPEGKNIPIVSTIFPIKNEKGEVTNAVITNEDVTEQKKAEKALKKSEEQLRLITDALPVYIFFIDNDLRYRFVNKAYEELFKKDRSEIIGRSMWEVAGEKAIQKIYPKLEKVLKGEPQYMESQQDYGEFGNRYLSINLIPNSIDGVVDGFYALGYDISERRKTEQELEILYKEAKLRNEELNRINTDLDNFIYTASHDLKSPVANLEGLLQLLEKKMKNSVGEQELKVMNMMTLSVGKLKKTIEDLVEITKIQKQQGEHPLESIPFKPVLEDIKADLQLLIEESKAEIQQDFQIEKVEYITSYLRSILYNLLSNAIKYRSPERIPKILVKTFLQAGEVVLQVKDNGLGLNESQQKKLFTMFKRMHTHVDGTGVGLYTIKRIIENNGGSIAVDSKEGVGTEFTITFNRKGLGQQDKLLKQFSK